MAPVKVAVIAAVFRVSALSQSLNKHSISGDLALRARVSEIIIYETYLAESISFWEKSSAGMQSALPNPASRGP